MIDGRNFFEKPINSTSKTYENFGKIAAGKGDDYTTGWLLDYLYFIENHKMIAIDLFVIIEEVKETIFELSQGTEKAL